ncbi:phosphatase YbhA domain protein [Candidatus Erwinia dacicola]|uniref:Phosphatase YbhA domain protein n=1 Tax=Candidatus Erwinia dacicola TaxID=252393 RepID=A0A328TIS3_9GAMM|nr:phosphatase YbhA domain protein [Candidatus Erwinia dacicola]
MLESDPLPQEQALRIVKMLDGAGIHGLLYVDNAMLYQAETGHVTRTINWGLSLPEHQRPTFLQAESLADAGDGYQI